MASKSNQSDSTLACEGTRHLTFIERWARGEVFKLARRLDAGSVRIRDPWGHAPFTLTNDATALRVHIEVRDPRFYRSLVLGGSLGAAEAYMAGWWSCSDLTALMRIMLRNAAALRSLESGAARIGQAIHGALHRLRPNSIRGSRRNIGAHYDLSNVFFQQFLDPTLTYSCGIFASEQDSMETASVTKLDGLCRKLALTADDHVLEIGTGWGSFALHAAKHYGCRVTTTTISAEQYTLARVRIEGAGLGDRITVLKEDYRQLTGTYDKLVSIEMIEAVGHAFLPGYFRQCAKLLKPGGTMALQAITMRDQDYDQYRKRVDFINRYIFPGGCLPSMTALCQAMTRASDLQITDLEDITAHYPPTLARWRKAFLDHLPEIRQLGFSEEFIRMWEYYLCTCEGGFQERSIGTVQLVLTKPQAADSSVFGDRR